MHRHDDLELDAFETHCRNLVIRSLAVPPKISIPVYFSHQENPIQQGPFCLIHVTQKKEIVRSKKKDETSNWIEIVFESLVTFRFYANKSGEYAKKFAVLSTSLIDLVPEISVQNQFVEVIDVPEKIKTKWQQRKIVELIIQNTDCQSTPFDGTLKQENIDHEWSINDEIYDLENCEI